MWHSGEISDHRLTSDIPAQRKLQYCLRVNPLVTRMDTIKQYRLRLCVRNFNPNIRLSRNWCNNSHTFDSHIHGKIISDKLNSSHTNFTLWPNQISGNSWPLDNIKYSCRNFQVSKR